MVTVTLSQAGSPHGSSDGTQTDGRRAGCTSRESGFLRRLQVEVPRARMNVAEPFAWMQQRLSCTHLGPPARPSRGLEEKGVKPSRRHQSVTFL